MGTYTFDTLIYIILSKRGKIGIISTEMHMQIVCICYGALESHCLKRCFSVIIITIIISNVSFDFYVDVKWHKSYME